MGTTLTAFIIYLALIFAVAIWAAVRGNHTTTDYFLGGRGMQTVVVALSAVTSGRSSWLILGVTGIAFMVGVSAVWYVVGYIVMEVLLFFYVAPKVRRFTGRMENVTLTDYFVSRFGGGKALRAVIATVLLLFMIAYVSAQFSAGGTALAGTFGLDPDLSLAITVAIVLLYVFIGGYVAVAWSDAIQAVFMIFGLVLLPLVVLSQLGWEPMLATVRALDPSLLDAWALATGALVSAIGIGLGSPGQPHLVVRYMSIDDPKNLRAAGIWGTVWNVLMGWGAVTIGLLGRAVYEDVEGLPGAHQEQTFLALAGDYLPAIVTGLLVAAIFAAIMSTVDSQLLVSASTVVRDFYQQLIRADRPTDEAAMVRLSRLAVLAMTGLAVAFIYTPGASDLVFELVLFAWGGLGAAFGPTLLASAFWTRTTSSGVMASVLTGTAVVISYFYLIKPIIADWQADGSWESFPNDELVWGFLVSSLVLILVSLATSPPADRERISAALTPGGASAPLSGR
ncbi:sodium/proline symporter [Nesterenkonia sp. CL21]|uniref:sodium/proline symporter n=1 Tax=Nesterenkonia sp. CL21 TaxID=3064894 RepID=UPI0028795DF7|nr:sodium/proline symporter [Nesterenkonia sp. CL21]MDS2171355.1 sodium/proline symporter [Nesterenkonia sp. CL21]